MNNNKKDGGGEARATITLKSCRPSEKARRPALTLFSTSYSVAIIALNAIV